MASILVESMKRLYKSGKITKANVKARVKSGKITEDEYVLKLIVGHAIDDITEKVYTHRTVEQLRTEMNTKITQYIAEK